MDHLRDGQEGRRMSIFVGVAAFWIVGLIVIVMFFDKEGDR